MPTHIVKPGKVLRPWTYSPTTDLPTYRLTYLPTYLHTCPLTLSSQASSSGRGRARSLAFASLDSACVSLCGCGPYKYKCSNLRRACRLCGCAPNKCSNLRRACRCAAVVLTSAPIEACVSLCGCGPHKCSNGGCGANGDLGGRRSRRTEISEDGDLGERRSRRAEISESGDLGERRSRRRGLFSLKPQPRDQWGGRRGESRTTYLLTDSLTHLEGGESDCPAAN